ncbi:hypothetical protein HYQ45_008775 [Verticillium longisporum]|uniref:4'-phosphopantetheinyl transferase domain-containing protein n=1 Tax=Verticillium longisporum TaxID=100787 RepID=A0A8I2ZLN3_VERLO|nr:hypothetical protein HYQ44_019209 [Verticillium longisporum]KAG7132978.1 hypothetical protein HYQ45_008775 [Verticillium longisporum]
MPSSSSDSPHPPRRPHLVQWILDTRTLWPEATRTKDLEHAASRALALLTPDERAGVLRFYHVRDAKLSLGSHLLKRHAIARFCGVPWSRAVPTRDTPTAKPTWRDPAGREPLRFNVSHQAGLVALIAVHDDQDPGALEVDVGVDVVCTSERRVRDRATIAAEGWPHFVDVHADVFSPREVAYLQHGIMAPVHQLPGRPGGGASADEVADFQLRCFYALWCLREAYVKMTGEALLAPWLRDLEFRGFRAPAAASGKEGGRLNVDEAEGTAVRQHEIYLEGKKVEDANVCLKSVGPDYMVCAAVRTPGRKGEGLALRLGDFELVRLEELIAFAEAAS